MISKSSFIIFTDLEILWLTTLEQHLRHLDNGKLETVFASLHPEHPVQSLFLALYFLHKIFLRKVFVYILSLSVCLKLRGLFVWFGLFF